MRFAILSEKSGWHTDDLMRAATARGHEAVACSWRALVGEVAVAGGAAQRAGSTALSDADAVLVRTMPAGTLEQVVFRMDLLQRLETAGVRVINPPRAIEAAVDKYLSLARLEAAGLPVPATVACQRVNDAMQAFTTLGGDVVVKSLFGSEGYGMLRVSDPDLAARTFATLERLGAVIYLQQFIDHGGYDVRLFVIDDQVIAAMRRVSDDWRTNVARGGRGEAMEPDDALCDLARRAAAACGALIAGVDVLTDRAGRRFVLEINAVPGWQALGPVTGVDIAGRVIAFAESVCEAPVEQPACD